MCRNTTAIARPWSFPGARNVITAHRGGPAAGSPCPGNSTAITYHLDPQANKLLMAWELAILDEEPWLDKYYAKNVIGGLGAFLEVADDFDSFAEAMRRKLRREIGSRPLALR